MDQRWMAILCLLLALQLMRDAWWKTVELARGPRWLGMAFDVACYFIAAFVFVKALHHV